MPLPDEINGHCVTRKIARLLKNSRPRKIKAQDMDPDNTNDFSRGKLKVHVIDFVRPDVIFSIQRINTRVKVPRVFRVSNYFHAVYISVVVSSYYTRTSKYICQEELKHTTKFETTYPVFKLFTF